MHAKPKIMFVPHVSWFDLSTHRFPFPFLYKIFPNWIILTLIVNIICSPNFRQAEVHSVGNENPPKEVQPDEENESESTNSPQQHKMPSLLLHRKSHNEQILEVNQKEEANTNSRSDLPRSESIRSNLTLNLGNSSQIGQPNKVRSRPTITTSRTTPSLSMISSLISLESFRANKEKRQQSGNTFSANVQAQVRTVHVYKSYLWNFQHFSFHFLFLWLPYIRHTIQRNPIFLYFIWCVWLHLLYPGTPCWVRFGRRTRQFNQWASDAWDIREEDISNIAVKLDLTLYRKHSRAAHKKITIDNRIIKGWAGPAALRM